MGTPVADRHELEILGLIRCAAELGAAVVGGPLSEAERVLLSDASEPGTLVPHSVEEIRSALEAGADPLGEILCRLRSPQQKRSMGAFYTPRELVEPMVAWALRARPQRFVDPGCGSGRFCSAAVRRAPELEILAVDLDPVATLLARASLAVLGARHARVVHGDYTTLELGRSMGRTAFVGNPPYVRHHKMSPEQKSWAANAGRKLGCRVSGLSGLHAHFYLATAIHAGSGDVGCFVTSAEWLDVDYGSVVRDLLVNGLGARALHLVDFEASPFDDAQTTAVVVCFEAGNPGHLILRRLVRSVADLGHLDLGDPIPRDEFASARRWTSLLRESATAIDSANRNVVPLGSIVRVHRGLVTGGNDFFVLTRERARRLGIERWCRPAITAAMEILGSEGMVRDAPERKVLLDVPADVDRSVFPELDAYLRLGEATRAGRPAVAQGYICQHRRPWWNLGRQKPAPVVASYMARRPPVFALNRDGLALVNIGHGLYPRKPMDWSVLEAFVARLNASRERFRGRGRTYQGGLEKFEPREMEELMIEWPDAQ